MALRITSELVKFRNLKAQLGVPFYAAIGILEALWHFTAKNAIQGDVGRHTNKEIASWIEWPGDADKLIDVLVECRWLDKHSEHRLIVHDWHEHADKSTKAILRNRKIPFVYADKLTAIPKEITGAPEMPVGVPPECRVQSAECGVQSAGAESEAVPECAPHRVDNPFEHPPQKHVFGNPIARFDERVQQDSRAAFDSWRMWRDGSLANLQSDSTHKDLNRLAAATEAQPGTIIERMAQFIRCPPPGWPRDVPLWKILKHLGYDGEVSAQTKPISAHKPQSAEEVKQRQDDETARLGGAITAEQRKAIKAKFGRMVTT